MRWVGEGRRLVLLAWKVQGRDILGLGSAAPQPLVVSEADSRPPWLAPENESGLCSVSEYSLPVLLGAQTSPWGEGLQSTTELRKPKQFLFFGWPLETGRGAVCWVCQELSHH